MRKMKISMEYNKLGSNEVIFEGESYYESCLFDEVRITKKDIIIIGERGNRNTAENIISNTNSTLYLQLLKGILFAYLTEGTKFEIDKIVVECGIEKKEYYSKDILNPCMISLNNNLKVDASKCKLLFSDKSKAKDLLIAMILYIKGYENNDFEYLWKAFNSLYSCISHKDKEFDKLADMKIFFQTNVGLLNRTVDLISKETTIDIRKLRLREFVLNNFEDRAKTRAYADMVMSFKDYRLNEIFLEIMPYRRDYLQSCALYVDVENHINTYITNREIHEIDLIRFYILKYAYFLRNKYFHAEKSSPIFILKKNNEIDEIDKINNIMECLLADLFNCADLYIL